MHLSPSVVVLLAGAGLAQCAPSPSRVMKRVPVPSPVRLFIMYVHHWTWLTTEQTDIPVVSIAETMLRNLRVAPIGSSDGYSRAQFPHWITQSGKCNTREVVLKRDGTNVTQNSACAAVSGLWKSPYDGESWTDADDIQIDHMVPLANAWRVRKLFFFV